MSHAYVGRCWRPPNGTRSLTRRTFLKTGLAAFGAGTAGVVAAAGEGKREVGYSPQSRGGPLVRNDA